MPYRNYNRRRFRKRRYKKRRYTRKPSTWGEVKTMATTGYSLAKKLARFVNTEIKYKDTLTSALVSNTGGIYALDVIPQGDGPSARSGDSIKPMTLSGRGSVSIGGSAVHTIVRMIIFRGKMENDVEPVVGDIFASTGPLQPKVYDKRFKTKFLWDKTFTVDAGQTRQIVFNINQKIFGHINYDASQTDGTDHESGGIYLLMISDEGTNYPTCTLCSRLTYVDN